MDVDRVKCLLAHLGESVCVAPFEKILTDMIKAHAEERAAHAESPNLMEECDIPSVSNVAKIGDTTNDMREGKNAGCGLLVGVLSGAAKRKDFESCGIVDKIYGSIMDLYN